MAPTTGSSFFGRRDELAVLEFALQTRPLPGPRLFLVTGEAGIGKTCFAEQVAERARATGARVAWGRSWEAGGAPAYWPWIQVLRELAAADPPRAGEVLGALGGWLPGRGTSTPAHPNLALGGGDEQRFALFDGVAGFLRARAGGRVLVVVLDDLHAADPGSLRLLQFLACDRSSPLLLLGTARDEPADRDPATAATLAELAREGRSLPLRGLEEHDVAQLVEGLTGGRLATALTADLRRRTGGNPLFLVEIVRALDAEGRRALSSPRGNCHFGRYRLSFARFFFLVPEDALHRRSGLWRAVLTAC